MKAMRWIKKLYRRLRVSNLALRQLESMTAELHACRSFAEAYQVIARFTQRLLPGVGGALFMGHNGTYQRVKMWGRFQPGKRKFPLRECSALRRMKVHVVKDPHDLHCPHVLKASGPYVCLPLMGGWPRVRLTPFANAAPAWPVKS